jgi:hypothetical protein
MKHAFLAAWAVLLCLISASAANDAKPEQFNDTRFLDKLEKSGLLTKLYW